MSKLAIATAGAGVLAVMGVGNQSHAAIINADAATTEVRDTSSPLDGVGDDLNASFNSLNVGTFDPGNEFRSAVLVFQLPDLGGAPVTADASVFVGNFGTSNKFNVDIQALRVDSSNTVNVSDYAVGQPPFTDGSTVIQDNFLTSASGTNQRDDLSTAGQAALATYVNANYAAGDYLFLRLTGDAANNGNDVTGNGGTRFVFNNDLAAQNANGGGNPPQLTLNAIPEPASLALLGVGGLAMLGRRRRGV